MTKVKAEAGVVELKGGNLTVNVETGDTSDSVTMGELLEWLAKETEDDAARVR